MHDRKCWARPTAVEPHQLLAMAEALAKGGAHMLIAETMNTWDEAACAIEGTMASGCKLPLIVSMQVVRKRARRIPIVEEQ